MTNEINNSELSSQNKAWKDQDWNWYFAGNPDSKNKLLLLHGWNTFGAKSWHPFISYLVDKMGGDIFVVAIDMPGFGRSSEPKEVWSAQDYAKSIYEFVSEIYPSSTSWNLLGHSFGGAVSASIASAYPKWCNKLVLVAPAIVRENPTGSKNLLVKISQAGKKLLPHKITSWLKTGWRRLLGANDYAKTSEHMEKIMKQVVRQDMQFLLGNIALPVLLVWGEVDKYTPIAQAYKIQKALSIVDLKTLPDINHGVHLHAYKILGDWTKDFLASKS